MVLGEMIRWLKLTAFLIRVTKDKERRHPALQINCESKTTGASVGWSCILCDNDYCRKYDHAQREQPQE